MNISNYPRWALPLPPHVRADGWGPPMGIVRPYVGVLRSYVGNSAEDARDVVRLIDDVAAYFPVTAIALSLQDSIFKWAELFGIKDQVEYIVYALRAAGGIGGTVAAAGSSAAVSAGIGSAGALSVALPVAAAVVALFAFLSSDDGEEKQNQKLKVAQARISHLRDRLTLADFSSEQRTAASDARAYAENPVTAVLSPQYLTQLKKDADVSDRIADLYDKAENELPSGEKALFESISNLSRWRGVLDSYSKMSQTEQDNFDSIGFGTSEPRLPHQLKSKVEAEEKTVAKLSAQQQSSDEPSLLWSGVKVLLALSAGGALGLYLLEPALARSLLSRGISAVTHAPQLIRKALPR